MPKISRIGPRQVVDNTRSPEREALRSAIEHHAALKAALAENKTSQERAEEARYVANKAADKATQALAEAKATDAFALAAGTPGGAVKSARSHLRDAEDTQEAARSAGTLLEEQHGRFQNDLALSSARVNEAVSAVVRNDSAELLAQYRAAQIKFHEAGEAMRVAMAHYPSAANGAWWEQSGLPSHVRFWEAINWAKDLPPSPVAAKVRQWIERLRTDADARIEID